MAAATNILKLGRALSPAPADPLAAAEAALAAGEAELATAQAELAAIKDELAELESRPPTTDRAAAHTKGNLIGALKENRTAWTLAIDGNPELEIEGLAPKVTRLREAVRVARQAEGDAQLVGERSEVVAALWATFKVAQGKIAIAKPVDALEPHSNGKRKRLFSDVALALGNILHGLGEARVHDSLTGREVTDLRTKEKWTL